VLFAHHKILLKHCSQNLILSLDIFGSLDQDRTQVVLDESKEPISLLLVEMPLHSDFIGSPSEDLHHEVRGERGGAVVLDVAEDVLHDRFVDWQHGSDIHFIGFSGHHNLPDIFFFKDIQIVQQSIVELSTNLLF
jgi:hypothetical protein